MHLPTGPTAVYHHHHHHHHAASQLSPPNSDWTLNNNNNNNINNNLKIGGGNGSSNSILEPPTSSGTSSPPGSNSSASQDLWWTERLILEAQQEFPGELGKCISLHDRKCQRTNFLLDTRRYGVCVQFKIPMTTSVTVIHIFLLFLYFHFLTLSLRIQSDDVNNFIEAEIHCQDKCARNAHRTSALCTISITMSDMESLRFTVLQQHMRIMPQFPLLYFYWAVLRSLAS